MALSMDEQHILAEIEERLSRSEPALAAQLSTFGRPQAGERTPRALVVAAFATMIVMAFVSLLLYALIPFGTMRGRVESTNPATAPPKPAMSVRGGSSTPQIAPQVSPGAYAGNTSPAR